MCFVLRVAVPNKGSLHGPAVELLSAAGYQVHRDGKALFAADAANGVQYHARCPRRALIDTTSTGSITSSMPCRYSGHHPPGDQPTTAPIRSDTHPA